MDAFLDWYAQHSPFQRYPVESLIVSVTLFCISLWALGSRINRDIANQVAIPIIKEIKDMGFRQNPAFNTLSHPMKRGYIEFPSLSDENNKKNEKSAKKDDKNTSVSDKNTPIYPTIESVTSYLWPEAHHSYHLYASGHDDFKGIHCHIQTIPRHDMLMQIGSLLKILNNRDTITIQISFQYLEPFFWSLSKDPQMVKDLIKDYKAKNGGELPQKKKDVKSTPQTTTTPTTTTITTTTTKPDTVQENTKTGHIFDSTEKNKDSKEINTKPEIIGNIVDLGGLKLTHAVFSPESEYIFTTDTPELLHDPTLTPCSTILTTFLTNLNKETQNAFDFVSLEISDQSDSYDVVKLSDIPSTPEVVGDDVPHQEESALITLCLQFNFENVPRQQDDQNQDHNNQKFVNEWMTKICSTLFALSYEMLNFRLPQQVKKNNIKMRQNFDPGQQLRSDSELSSSSSKSHRQTNREEKLAREGMSNSIIGTGNLTKRKNVISSGGK